MAIVSNVHEPVNSDTTETLLGAVDYRSDAFECQGPSSLLKVRSGN